MCKEKAKSAEEVACEARPVIFKPDCIFCGVIRYKKVWHLGARIPVNTINFERDGGDLVLKAVKHKGDTKLNPQEMDPLSFCATCLSMSMGKYIPLADGFT